jgi:hypothetical protein
MPLNKDIVTCIDCDETISKLAKSCPHCGRPWPTDGKNPYSNFLKKAVVNILRNLHYVLGLLAAGAMLGAGIQSHLETSNYHGQANFYFWNDFIGSSILGTPILLGLMAVAIAAGIAAKIIWHWLEELYLKIEFRIISIKSWPNYTDVQNGFVLRQQLETKRRKTLRWIIVSPFILIFLSYIL